MFRLIAVLWWFGLGFHFGIAFFVMIAGSQGAVPAVVVWALWGTLVLSYFVRRRVMGRWLYRLRVKRAPGTGRASTATPPERGSSGPASVVGDVGSSLASL